MVRKILFILFLFGIGIQANASITSAIVDGDWSEATTWNNGVPGCIDTIVIPAGIQVDITSTVDLEGCADSVFILISGTLDFQTGKKLKLPCLSDVVLMTGGSMGVGGGGGASTYLDICGTEYWNAGSGNLNGPQSLCDGGCPGSQLPIELLFFNATLNEQLEVVDLDWTTMSEVDNDFFTVQRSEDGINWTNLFDVDGAGSSSSELNYLDEDRDPLYGKSYYRLKQTDFNGAFSYSPIVTIYQGGGSEMIIYPNPVVSGGNMNIDFNYLVLTFPDIVDKDLLVEVVTVEGKLMYSTTVDLTQTKQLFIPIGSEYAPGLYSVTTSYQNSKFIVR